jgi:acyl-CoA reductase-like NAD-dependent aldehyde dehydrogenase
MQALPHIPILRHGRPYTSLDQLELQGFRGGKPFARVSQANPGLIRRDLLAHQASFEILQRKTTREMVGVCRRAGDLFMEEDLPVGETDTQSAEQFCQTLSEGSGLPRALVRKNMEKIRYVLSEMPAILNGLTRGLDPAILEEGMARQNDLLLSFFPASHALGVVLPSNSPGVNSLWLPALALRIPVVLKPGREDPWTPWRIIQALAAAGCPREAVGFYPTGHGGAEEILQLCGRGMVFGDASTVARYAADPSISVHGPGYSKVLIGEDCVDRFSEYVDVIVDSIVMNGGRSCVNASTIVAPSRGAEIAEAVARRLASLEPLPLDHPRAELAAFANPAMADLIDTRIEEGLRDPGAEDVTARFRSGPRRIEVGGATFLRPTLVHAGDSEHPLGRTEFLFPFAAVVEVPPEHQLNWIGPTLAATVITEDPLVRNRCLASPNIDRLNIGAIPTPSVRWDQPHEGNLFEFLYRRRAIQQAV